MQLNFGQKIFKKVTDYLKITLSISGFVPNHSTVGRILLMAGIIAVTIFFSREFYGNFTFALVYYFITTGIYLSFITSVLSQYGYRLWFIKKFGEKDGYLVYEAVLGAIFFMQGAGLGYLASSTPVDFEMDVTVRNIIQAVAIVFLIVGFGIKIWATKVVSVDIYYWKDMFLGRRIRDFVVKGPYKFVSNPMYGLGHLQAYATAIWYFSLYGLFFALLNQVLVFSFYFLVEKKFIKRVYLSKVQPLPTQERRERV